MADFEDAGNRAFRFLFSYISGDNTAQQTIDMTSPVVQAKSQRVAMTAPAGASLLSKCTSPGCSPG
ncbi:hypothetical protein ADILRU_0545 [Leifsonia rubra CMS 76R]|nr:hypothetical protein ADILRU_0545 [Leifsonia rubra CMS 76R]